MYKFLWFLPDFVSMHALPSWLKTLATSLLKTELERTNQVTHGSSICLPGSASHAVSFESDFSTQFPVQRRWRCSSGGSQPLAVGGVIRDGLTTVALAGTSTSASTDGEGDASSRAAARYRSSTVGWGGTASSWARDSLTSRIWRRTARRAAAESLPYSCSSSVTDLLARYRW